MPRITPNLWFDTDGEQAAEFYVSVFPNSAITAVTHYGEAGPREAGTVLTVEFVLDGQPFTAINGGPEFTFDEAISFAIECADQDEIDYYWNKLSEGGEEGPCGWLKDRYGLSWQVVPEGMVEMLNDPDQERGQRAMKAMLGMKKIDVAALYAAADQDLADPDDPAPADQPSTPPSVPRSGQLSARYWSVNGTSTAMTRLGSDGIGTSCAASSEAAASTIVWTVSGSSTTISGSLGSRPASAVSHAATIASIVVASAPADSRAASARSARRANGPR